MGLLLRLLLTGLVPPLLAAGAWFVTARWEASLALALGGLVLAAVLYQRLVIGPMQRLTNATLMTQQRQSLLQTVLDDAPLIIAIKDTDGRYQMINREWGRQYGLTEDEVRGRRDIDFFPPENAAIFRASDLKVLESGEKMSYPVRIQSLGQWRRLETTKFPLRGPDQRVIGVGLMATNFTELALSQEKFSRVFHASPDWIVISRMRDDVVVDANEGFERISGHTRASVIGHPIDHLDVWVDATQYTDMVAHMQREGAVHDSLVQLRCQDGRIIDCMAHASLIALEGEANSHAVWIARDVTQARRADAAQRESEARIRDLNTELEDRVLQRTQQLQESNAELSQTLQRLNQTKDQLVQSEKLAALGALVAGVAHELNTPIGNGLTVASTLDYKAHAFANTLATGVKRSALEQFVAETQFASDILVRNLTQAGALVTSFKQVAVDQTSSQRRTFELANLVAEIIQTLSPTIRKSGIDVVSNIAEGVQLDSFPGPLGQVLTNLINNAMVHGYDERQNGTIAITAQRLSADAVEVRVADDGRGIDPSHLKRIFDPFFTTRLGLGGSGLGLHIVHNIVTGVLGGTIEACSQAPQGAEFVLRLPLTAPEAG